MCIIIDSADIDNNEVLLEVLPKHEENPVISTEVHAHLYLLLRGYFGPEFLVVFAGCAFPLHAAPWISYFKHAERRVVYAKLDKGIFTIV